LTKYNFVKCTVISIVLLVCDEVFMLLAIDVKYQRHEPFYYKKILQNILLQVDGMFLKRQYRQKFMPERHTD
jgi:hypothetical protein